MEPNTTQLEVIDSLIEAADPVAWNSALAIFGIGAIAWAALAKKHNSFTLWATILAVHGLKRTSRTSLMNLVHFLTIVITLALFVYAVTNPPSK